MAKAKKTERQTLAIERREIIGSRSVKRLRREGLVPAVVYGRDMDPLAVSVNQRELVRFLHSKSSEHALVMLRLSGSDAWEKPALVQAVQHEPVDGHVLHVDFHAVILTERVRVAVSVVLKGEPVGVKQEGGLLEHFLREVEVECLPTEIPEQIEFDVSALKIGQTVHVRDLEAPKGAKILTDPEGAIASVQMPKEEKPEEEAPSVTEPEVIREKKEEETASAEGGEGERSEPKKEAKKEAKA